MAYLLELHGTGCVDAVATNQAGAVAAGAASSEVVSLPCTGGVRHDASTSATGQDLSRCADPGDWHGGDIGGSHLCVAASGIAAALLAGHVCAGAAGACSSSETWRWPLSRRHCSCSRCRRRSSCEEAGWCDAMSSAWSQALRRCLPSWSYRPGSSACLALRRLDGLSAADMATVLGKAFLLPLAVGMLLRAMAPTLSERFADRVLAMAGVVLTLAGLALLAMHWQLFIAVRWQGMVALVVLLLLAVAIGHVLGGPHPDDRTALAIACATRHIGVAVIVATAFRGPRTMVLLAAYVVASAVVSIPYLQWRRRQARVEAPMVGGA